MAIYEVKHSLIKHKLGWARRADTPPKLFRELIDEISALLLFRATELMPVVEVEVEGWAGSVRVERCHGPDVTLVPVLRAGLGMLRAATHLLPNAPVTMLGIQRDLQTLRPTIYLEAPVPALDQRTALVLDPILATGGTIVEACDLLQALGCKALTVVHVLATPEGVARLQRCHPEVDVYVASIEDGLTPEMITFPGLGDAGDRLWGTASTSPRREQARSRLRDKRK